MSREERLTKNLPCKLTRDERIQFGERNAREVQLLTAAEEVKKDAAAAMKLKIEAHQSEIRRLSEIVTSGQEWRQVDCARLFDYSQGRVSVIRRDTGEIVESRLMTDREKQMELSLEVPEDGDEDAPGQGDLLRAV